MLEFTERKIAEQYELGKVDCFRLCYDFIVENGTELPDGIGNVTIHNYARLFKDDPQKAIHTMIRFMETNLEEIKPNQAFAGDILLLRLNGSHPFLAIHGGNGNIISATEEYGVRTTPIKHYKLKRAFKCHKRYHY